MSWRSHDFESGRRYRVVGDCDVSLDRIYQFSVGDILTYCQDSYSRYDNLSVYLFRRASGEELYWTLHDSEPHDKWKTIFEGIDETIAA